MTTEQPQPAQRGWTVTTQVQGTVSDGAGKFVPGWMVGFRTAGGLNGTVAIPDNLYNAAAVRSAIEAQVAKMLEIQQLHG